MNDIKRDDLNSYVTRVFARHYPNMFFNLLSLVTKNVTTMPCLRHELELVGFTGVGHLTVWSPPKNERNKSEQMPHSNLSVATVHLAAPILYFISRHKINRWTLQKLPEKINRWTPQKKSPGFVKVFFYKHICSQCARTSMTRRCPPKLDQVHGGPIFFTTRGGGSAPKDGFNQWTIWWTTKMWIINGF